MALAFSFTATFGQMTAAAIKSNLFLTNNSIDTEAAAIVLLEQKEVTITRQVHGSEYHYQQREHVYRAIKIIGASALKEADVQIGFRQENIDNHIEGIKGTTYTLHGTVVTESSLDKSSIARPREQNDSIIVSFFMPNVKEGCVIEYSYDIVTHVGLLLPRWDVQGIYPKLTSTYSISYPLRLEFTSIAHLAGDMKEYPSAEDALNGVDDYCQVKVIPGNPDDPLNSFWLRRNIPAVKKDDYLVNVANNTERLTLQLTGYLTQNGMVYIKKTWAQLADDLMDESRFGAVYKSNAFLADVVDSIKNASPYPITIKAIYNYVRNNFTCDKYSIYVEGKAGLRDIFYKKRGNSAELNMLLCAMLLRAGISAAPLYLGTTSQISPDVEFPALDRFNYLACVLKQGPGYTLLDASDKNNVFGILPHWCYNGYALIVAKGGQGIQLDNTLIKDKTVTAVKISNFTEAAASIEITQKVGLMLSSALRKAWANDPTRQKRDLGQGITDMQQIFKGTLMTTINETTPDTNIIITTKGVLQFDQRTNTVAINSAMIEAPYTNLFPRTIRTLPIELPYSNQYQYNMSISLPAWMDKISIPQPIQTDMDSGSIGYNRFCEYYEPMHTINLKTTFNVAATTYQPQQSKAIGEFLSKISILEKDQIILSKNPK